MGDVRQGHRPRRVHLRGDPIIVARGGSQPPWPPQALTPAVFALLLALYDGDRHGYALMADVEELTGGTITLGVATLYRSLQRMRVDGLVEEVAGDTVAERPADRRADRRAERRRSYRITPAGCAAAAAEARRLARLVDAAARAGLLDDAEAGDEDSEDERGGS